jgi:hypothetical protein
VTFGSAFDRRLWFVPLVVSAVAIAAAVVEPQAQTAPGANRTLRGSWSATGHVVTLPTESGRDAAVVQLSGSLVLTDDSGAHAGFQGEAISFDSGNGTTAGRAVWTDSRGDRLFSVLRGESVGTGRRVIGTIQGGTGKFAGVAGDFALTWQYVVSSDDGALQGRTNDLVVHYRQQGSQP